MQERLLVALAIAVALIAAGVGLSRWLKGVAARHALPREACWMCLHNDADDPHDSGLCRGCLREVSREGA